METFFTDMDVHLQVYWYIACGASIIFIIQTILAFIGSDSDSFDGDLDVTEHSFHLLSFRNLINFLLGFGWTGVLFYPNIDNKLVLGIVAFVVGLLFIALFFLIMRSLWKLAENNAFRMDEAVKKTAEVYLTIPPNKEGKGKVLVSVKGSVRELQAITYANKKIETGKLVTIVGIENTILIVDPL